MSLSQNGIHGSGYDVPNAFGASSSARLTEADVTRLRSLNDPIDLAEAEKIYIPLSDLILRRVEEAGGVNPHQAFIIGIAGPVAVGKSTTARLLCELIRRWLSAPKVELVTTDGFLWPNDVLKARNLMSKKGFPESYDISGLSNFVSTVARKGGKCFAPNYSHLSYDIIRGPGRLIENPDIMVLEGVNVLQNSDRREHPAASLRDHFSFTIYIDADELINKSWYIERFLKLRTTAFKKPESYFHRYSLLPIDDAIAIAERLWTDINLKNLHENILPSRSNADLVIKKGASHLVEELRFQR